MKSTTGWIASGCFALALLLGGCASALEDSGSEEPAQDDSPAVAPAARPGFALEHGEEVFDVADVQVIPKVAYAVAPQYPFTLPEAGIHAEVILWTVVHADGTVDELSVESSTNAEFNQSAIDAVKQWKFLPALRDDVPVACRIRVPVEFNKPRPKSR
jgi:TonB family protein